MANVTGVGKLLLNGINNEGIHRRHIQYTGACVNNDTCTTVFTDLKNGWRPVGASCGSYGAGSVGSRVYTASAITITTWDESTGTLVLTFNANVTNPVITVTFANESATPT